MLFLYCSLLFINQAENQLSFLLPLLMFILGGLLCVVSQALEMTHTLLPVHARCGCHVPLGTKRSKYYCY